MFFFCSSITRFKGICTHCCSAIDKLADFFYHNQDRETATAMGLKKLIIDHMPLLNDLLGILFQILCFEPQCLFQWSISRPMLALIVINPANFQALKVKLCQAMLTPEHAQRMSDALRDLMIDIEPNLSGKNRDLFTQRLSTFRHTVWTDCSFLSCFSEIGSFFQVQSIQNNNS